MKRIGIIGLSHDHVWDVLPDLAASEDAELVAVASAQLPLLERAKKEHGVATYPDAAEMAAGETLDAVYIYGNNRAGAKEGAKALERGWHVLIEKPLGVLRQFDKAHTFFEIGTIGALVALDIAQAAVLLGPLIL